MRSQRSPRPRSGRSAPRQMRTPAALTLRISVASHSLPARFEDQYDSAAADAEIFAALSGALTSHRARRSRSAADRARRQFAVPAASFRRSPPAAASRTAPSLRSPRWPRQRSRASTSTPRPPVRFGEQHRELPNAPSPARAASGSICASGTGSGIAASAYHARMRPSSPSAPIACSRVFASEIAAGDGSVANWRGRRCPSCAVSTTGIRSFSWISGRIRAAYPRSPRPHKRWRPPCRAAGALRRRRLAGAFGDQPRDACRLVEARTARQVEASMTIHASMVRAGFGNARRQDQFAPAIGVAVSALRWVRDRSGRAGGERGGRPPPRPPPRRVRYRRPGEGEHVTLRFVGRLPYREQHARLSRSSARRPMWRSSSRKILPSLLTTGALPSSAPNRAPSSVADMATSRKSSRSPCCASIASASAKSPSGCAHALRQTAPPTPPPVRDRKGCGCGTGPGSSPAIACRQLLAVEPGARRPCRQPRRPFPRRCVRRRRARRAARRAARPRPCTRIEQRGRDARRLPAPAAPHDGIGFQDQRREDVGQHPVDRKPLHQVRAVRCRVRY